MLRFNISVGLIFLASLVPTVRCEECTCNAESLASRLQELETTVQRQDRLIKQLVDDHQRRTLPDERAADDVEESPSATPPTNRLILSGGLEPIAFTAYIDHNIDHMGNNQVIPYNNVITNIGGAFNVNTHTFNCPTSGIYLFTFVVAEYGQRELVAKLVVDGNNVVDAIANPVTGDHDQQGSNTAIIQVNQGQAVWVANYVWQDVYLRSDDLVRYATFSGVLLQTL